MSKSRERAFSDISKIVINCKSMTFNTRGFELKSEGGGGVTKTECVEGGFIEDIYLVIENRYFTNVALTFFPHLSHRRVNFNLSRPARSIN